MTPPHSTLSGLIAVMRQFTGADAMPLNAFAGDAGHTLRCLTTLRDDYGAARDSDCGWRLTYKPEWLSPPSAPLPVTLLDEVDSTQQYSRGCQAPHVVIAEHQSAGIGQRGRYWLSLPGDALAISVVLPAPAHIAGLSVALGAMLCTALCDKQQLRFKWPNDIVNTQHHKIAGILTEISKGRLIVGIGINWHITDTLSARLQADGATPAALASAQQAITRRQQCAQVAVQTIIDTVAAYDGFTPFRDMAQTAHIALIGDKLHRAGGEETFLGFAEDGALLTTNGRHYQHRINA